MRGYVPRWHGLFAVAARREAAGYALWRGCKLHRPPVTKDEYLPSFLPYDEMPARDFRARFTRRGGGRGFAHPARRKMALRRLGTLAAIVAVPAMANPAEWRAPASSTQPAEMQLMGFERAGESFPGSAFYYLEDTPRAADPLGTQAFAAADARFDGALTPAVDTLIAGTGLPNEPAARMMRIGGSGTDMARAQRCMTMAIYYEAASEPDAGQRAVAQVVLNRMAHPTYPATICGVVFQGSERTTGCQFSFTCDGSLARKPSAFWWNRAASVAREALAGVVYAPVGLATHYHTIQINPYWASSLHRVGTIGAHHFYRWRGAAGTAPAFSASYRGGEPLPQPGTRNIADGLGGILGGNPGDGWGADYAAASVMADPAALAKAYEDGLAAARAQGSRGTVASQTAYASSPAAEGLRASGTVRDEYARSGQWLVQP